MSKCRFGGEISRSVFTDGRGENVSVKIDYHQYELNLRVPVRYYWIAGITADDTQRLDNDGLNVNSTKTITVQDPNPDQKKTTNWILPISR
jgi:hypothetical protein